MSFGAFMEGLQGGVKSGQSIRRERQMDDIYDAARRKIKNEEAADDIGRKARNLPMGDDSALGDPLGQRIWDWASGLFKGGDDASAAAVTPPDPGAAAFEDKVQRVDSLTPEDGYASAPVQYAADGGQVQVFADGDQAKLDEEERKREQARAERYGATAKQAVPVVGNAVGKSFAAGPKTTKSALHGLADIVDKGTDDPIDPGMMGTVGQAVEYAFDAPRAAIGSGLRRAGDKIGGLVEPGKPKQALPTAAGQPTGPTNPRRYHGQGNAKAPAPAAAIPTPGAAPAAPAAAAPEKVLSEDVIKRIPWDKVNPMDLPKFKTQDWVAYRETAIDQMVMRGGVSLTDAMDKVDQQVIGMQQRGTKALLQEAIMRVQSGDLKGAGNALVQMFQYVPSGTDAVVGTYNGQLVAQFIDEQTGQPVGEPTPVDAKMLGDLWQQYANPAAWAQMAQDRAQLADTEKRTGILQGTLDLARDRYKNVEIPAAQSEAEYRAMAGQGAVLRALGGGSDGLKPSDGIALDKAATEAIDRYSMLADEDGNPLYPKLQDPGIREQLLAAIMVLSRRDPSRPPNLIVQDILNAAKE